MVRVVLCYQKNMFFVSLRNRCPSRLHDVSRFKEKQVTEKNTFIIVSPATLKFQPRKLLRNRSLSGIIFT